MLQKGRKNLKKNLFFVQFSIKWFMFWQLEAHLLKVKLRINSQVCKAHFNMGKQHTFQVCVIVVA